jgi:hypothetical protein
VHARKIKDVRQHRLHARNQIQWQHRFITAAKRGCRSFREAKPALFTTPANGSGQVQESRKKGQVSLLCGISTPFGPSQRARLKTPMSIPPQLTFSSINQGSFMYYYHGTQSYPAYAGYDACCACRSWSVCAASTIQDRPKTGQAS